MRGEGLVRERNTFRAYARNKEGWAMVWFSI